MANQVSDISEERMKYIQDFARDYLKTLSDELDNIDTEALVCHYLSIFDKMKILALWQDKPKALFDYVSTRRNLQGDGSMALAVTYAVRSEHEFYDLVKRSEYDKNVFNALGILSSKHYQYSISLPYIPFIFRRWIIDYLAGRITPPTSEEKRRRFIRNTKIVKLLSGLCALGISPTRNYGTKPGQSGMDIVGKMMNTSPETIATVWRERYKYQGSLMYAQRAFKSVSDQTDTSEKMKNHHDEGLSDRNEEDISFDNLARTPDGRIGSRVYRCLLHKY